MRLKFIACKYTVFIPFRILARNIFFSFLSLNQSVCHFRNELDTYQTNFLFSKVIAQFIKRIINLISGRFLEIIIDIQQVVLFGFYCVSLLTLAIRN